MTSYHEYEKHIKETLNITSPTIIEILVTIKLIQKRMKEPDLVDKEFITVYSKLCDEFESFVERYGPIFSKVIRGESLTSYSAIFFYRNKFENGDITEKKINDMLMNKFMSESQRKEVNVRMEQLQKDNNN